MTEERHLTDAEAGVLCAKHRIDTNVTGLGTWVAWLHGNCWTRDTYAGAVAAICRELGLDMTVTPEDLGVGAAPDCANCRDLRAAPDGIAQLLADLRAENVRLRAQAARATPTPAAAPCVECGKLIDRIGHLCTTNARLRTDHDKHLAEIDRLSCNANDLRAELSGLLGQTANLQASLGAEAASRAEAYCRLVTNATENEHIHAENAMLRAADHADPPASRLMEWCRAHSAAIDYDATYDDSGEQDSSHWTATNNVHHAYGRTAREAMDAYEEAAQHVSYAAYRVVCDSRDAMAAALNHASTLGALLERYDLWLEPVSEGGWVCRRVGYALAPGTTPQPTRLVAVMDYLHAAALLCDLALPKRA